MFFRKKSTTWLRCSLGAVLLAGVVGGCGGGGARPPKWSFIAATIVEPNCATASCHSAVAQRAGVVLTPRDTAYKTLITRKFVIPGDCPNPGECQDSEMVALLRAQGSRRMPPDFALPEADIELIEHWINEGATND